MSSIEQYGFLLLFVAGVYFILRLVLSATRSVGGLDSARRSSMLLEAVQARKADEVQKLLDGDPDLDVRDSRGDSMLMIAVRNNDREIVRRLLTKGADVFAVNRRGQNVWEQAVALNAADGTVGSYARMVALLESEREVPTRLLLLACRSGDEALARHALDLGASADARDYFLHRRDLHKGATALMVAVENGHLELVKLLVEEGADIHFRCGWEDAPDTALELALSRGEYTVVEYLLMQSALRRARGSAYGAERRVERQLQALLERLPVLDPPQPGAHRSLRQLVEEVQDNDCAEILLAPGAAQDDRLTVLLGAVRLSDAEGGKLRSRWLEIRRVGRNDFVSSSYETIGPLERPDA